MMIVKVTRTRRRHAFSLKERVHHGARGVSSGLLALLTALVLMIPHLGWGQTSNNITTSLEVPSVPFAQASGLGGRNIITREPGLRDDARTALNEGDTIEILAANSSSGNDVTYSTTYTDTLEKRYARDVETARLNEERRTSPSVLESSPSSVTYIESEEDTDDDGMPDSWEMANSLDPDDPSDAWKDPDGDFVLNLFEYQLDSSPSNSLSPASVIVYADGNPMNAIANTPTGSIIRVESGNYNVNYKLYSPKTIMIQGGWNSDFTIRDPIVTPTTFDGRSLEEVLYFSFDGGMNSIILDGLTLINGNGNFGALAMIGSGTSVMKWSMINCRIIDSTEPEAYGGAIAHINHWESSQSDVFIIKSIIANNTSSGIANQTTGTASGRWKIIHTDITNNYSEDADEGYGIHAFTLDYAPLTIDLTNTILWGNQRTDLFVNQAITVNAEYSDVGWVDAYSGAIYNEGSGIFRADPLFVDADNADFNLEAGSPCIGTGIDIGLPFLDAAPDVGALEYTTVLDDGLVAWYPFNGNADDESGNANHGTVNGVTLVEDRFGDANSAYSFDGVDDVITGSLVSASGIDTAITTAAWFYQPVEAGHPGAGVVGVGAAVSGQHFYQRLFADHGDSNWDGADGQNRLFIGADDGINDRWWGSDIVITNNEWHFATTTYSSASLEVRIYIDGTPDRIINLSDDLSLTNYFFIGCDGHNDNYFEGLIDDIRIYNRALNAAEIENLYQEGGWPVEVATNTQYVTGTGEVTFPGTGMTMNFTSQTGADTIEVQAFPAAPSGTPPAGTALAADRYWIITHTGTGAFTAEMTLNLGPGAFTTDDQAYPGRLFLLQRDTGGTLPWEIESFGASATGSSVTFTDLTGFSQFAVGRTTDNEGPTIENVDDDVGVITEGPWVSADVNDPSGLRSITLHYLVGGNLSFDQIGMYRMSDNSYVGEIPDDDVTANGLAYYVIAVDSFFNAATSDTSSILVSFSEGTLQTNVSVSAFRNGFPKNKWRLISIPCDIADTTVTSIIEAELVEAPSDETWKIFRYTGPDRDDYVPVSRFTSGESYFLKQIVTEGPLHFTLGAGQSVDLTGWNITLPSRRWSFISSPYPFPVSVSADTATFDGPYAYGEFGSGGQEGWSLGQVQTTFRPWGGYIIYNNTTQTQILDIKPLRLSKNMLAKGDDYPLEGWLVDITVEGERYFDGGNTIGRLVGAAEGRDHFDTPEPPVLEGYISLAIERPEWADGTVRLTSDIRPLEEVNGIWNLVLRTRGEKGPINLSYKVAGKVPDDIQVALLDLMERQAYRLTAGENPEAITEYNESLPYHLKVITGTADFVEGAIEEVLSQLPENFALSQNYPNPFNAVTTIEYALPKPTRVSLRVYNVLGKEIVTLINDWQDIGYHEIAWNGVDHLGRDIASGIYFAVLQSEGVIKTRKMVLLK